MMKIRLSRETSIWDWRHASRRRGSRGWFSLIDSTYVRSNSTVDNGRYLALAESGLVQTETPALQQVRCYSDDFVGTSSSIGEMSSPKAFAVLRLITNSNLVGCCTGRSAGFAPLSIFCEPVRRIGGTDREDLSRTMPNRRRPRSFEMGRQQVAGTGRPRLQSAHSNRFQADPPF